MMLRTKYQGSRPCGFRQEDFFHVLPKERGAGPFMAPGALFE